MTEYNGTSFTRVSASWPKSPPGDNLGSAYYQTPMNTLYRIVSYDNLLWDKLLWENLLWDNVL